MDVLHWGNLLLLIISVLVESSPLLQSSTEQTKTKNHIDDDAFFADFLEEEISDIFEKPDPEHLRHAVNSFKSDVSDAWLAMFPDEGDHDHDHHHHHHHHNQHDEHLENNPQLQDKHDHDMQNHERHNHDDHQHKPYNGHAHHIGHNHGGTGTPLAEISSSIWLAGIGSILVISLVGVVSVVFIPLLQGHRGEYVLNCLISIAVGTLVGDSFIHLVPHAFQLTHDYSTTWKGFVATIVIIGFFLLDQLLSLKGMSHGHSHGFRPSDSSFHRHSISTSASPPPKYSKEDSGIEEYSSLSTLSYTDNMQEFHEGHDHDHEHDASLDSDHDHEHSHLHKASNMSNTSLMVIIGDAAHNLADGIAIGAAFSMGYATGVSTSIAVLCHELPHEIGDFAILIQNGLDTKTALFFNIVSSIFGLAGLCIGLLLGSAGEFSTWMLAGIVGVFLYVALVSMLPSLHCSSFLALFINISGMVAGACLLLVIGLYEEDLVSLFNN